MSTPDISGVATYWVVLLFVQDNTLYHPRRDVCIDRGSTSSEHARVRACDGRPAQVWEFSKTDDMD